MKVKMVGGFLWAVVMVVVMVMVVVVTVDASRQERQASRCSFGESCTPLFACVPFQTLLERPSPAVSHRIRQASCNRDHRNPKVCCPGRILATTPPPITFPTPITPTGSRCGPGKTCTPLSSCSAFQSLVFNPSRESQRRIRQAACSRSRVNPKVCCPGTVDSTPTPPGNGESLLPPKCRSRTKRQIDVEDFSTDVHAVVVGVPVKLRDSFSWMAVLGYNSRTSPFWGCGGSLVSEQYVITAAHCVHPSHTRGSTLEVVRLGELNLATGPVDCEDGTCAPPPQDFTPEQVILHPDFDTRGSVSDDIALIRLNKKATLNPYVEPLCLPPAGVGVEALLGGRQAEVSGWGLTEDGNQPDVLQKASLPFVNKATCNPQFFNELLPEQICFGGGRSDSCRGDSGGPLVLRGLGPLLIGIVSRGRDSRCGVVGLPAVYTHVAAYRNWVIQNLKP